MSITILDIQNIEEGGRGQGRVVLVLAMLVAAFIIWASVFPLAEVVVGLGKVVPPSKGQTIQSLEGGILSQLFVQEGDIVEIGQSLAQLNQTRFRSSLEEALAQARALDAAAQRLQAEIAGIEPIFSEDVRRAPALSERESDLYLARHNNLERSTASLREALDLANRELALTEPLVEKGAASDVEVIRLKREINELTAKIDDARDQFRIAAHQDYTKTMAELDALKEVIAGRADQLERTVLTSPVRGIVKNIDNTTIGGVIPPGGVLMEIVPLDEEMLIEARINPRDIAFIKPDAATTIKITAYDPSIYGTMEGHVEQISPDTLQDEVNKELYYYRVYIRASGSKLITKDGKEHPVMPGMVATAEIRTGAKTVLQYLLKPLNKAQEALRER